MSLFFKLLDPDPQKMNAVHSPASSTPPTNANCILHQVSPSTHKSAIAHITGQSQHTQDQSCLTAGTVSKQISPLTKQVGPLSNNRSTPSQTAIIRRPEFSNENCFWVQKNPFPSKLPTSFTILFPFLQFRKNEQLIITGTIYSSLKTAMLILFRIIADLLDPDPH